MITGRDTSTHVKLSVALHPRYQDSKSDIADRNPLPDRQISIPRFSLPGPIDSKTDSCHIETAPKLTILPLSTPKLWVPPTINPRFSSACYQCVGRIYVIPTWWVYSPIHSTTKTDHLHHRHIKERFIYHERLPIMSNEKHEDVIEPTHSSTDSINFAKTEVEDGEVFKTGEGLVNFRTVSWIHTSVIFLKRKWYCA